MATYTYQNATTNPLHIGRVYFRPLESKSYATTQPDLDQKLGPTLIRFVDGVIKNTPFDPDENVALSKAGYVVAQNWVSRTRTSQNVAGDATPAVLATVQIPGGIMLENSTLQITSLWSHTSSASSKSLLVYCGGQSIGAPAVTTSLTSRHLYQVHNANSRQAQKVLNASNGYNVSNNPLLSLAVDTRLPFDVEFRSKWGAAVTAETIGLEGFVIEVLP